MVTNNLFTVVHKFSRPRLGISDCYPRYTSAWHKSTKFRADEIFVSIVPPAGIEPTSPVPKTDTLSIKLRGQARNKLKLASDLISSAAPAKRSLSRGDYFSLCGYRESNPNLILGKDVFYH